MMPSPAPESSATRLVLVTFPDGETARQIGTVLVERKLAACITLLPGATSIYSWEGKTHTETEVQSLIKTSAAAYPALENTIRELHPYDTPEVLALTPGDGLPSYLRWILGQTMEHRGPARPPASP